MSDTADPLPVGTSVRFSIRSSDPPRLQSAKRRREYYHLLNVVAKNTGGKQSLLADVDSIKGIITDNGVEEASNRVAAAKQNGDLFEHDGRVCLARPDDLVAALEGSDEQELREALARRLAEVRSDG